MPSTYRPVLLGWGDSMIDAGIHPGDTVIVEKRRAANVGDIVIAILDNEFTLKRYAREKGRVVLRPENKAYPVIRGDRAGDAEGPPLSSDAE